MFDQFKPLIFDQLLVVWKLYQIEVHQVTIKVDKKSIVVDRISIEIDEINQFQSNFLIIFFDLDCSSIDGINWTQNQLINWLKFDSLRLTLPLERFIETRGTISKRCTRLMIDFSKIVWVFFLKSIQDSFEWFTLRLKTCFSFVNAWLRFVYIKSLVVLVFFPSF